MTNTCVKPEPIEQVTTEYEKIEYKTRTHKIVKSVPSPLGYNCVAYAKSKKNLPSGLTTASQKLSKTKTKNNPQVGDIGVTPEGPVFHLVVVEKILPDKQLLISESNYRRGFLTWRIIPQSLILGYF